MKKHRRNLGFDSLESLTLLSSLQPAVGHASPEVHNGTPQMPAFVRSVARAAERLGRHVVSVVPVESAPGSFTEYQITFMFHKNVYTTDITIDYPPHRGGQPVPGWDFESATRANPAQRATKYESAVRRNDRDGFDERRARQAGSTLRSSPLSEHDRTTSAITPHVTWWSSSARHSPPAG
jgi:hypothetical protein